MNKISAVLLSVLLAGTLAGCASPKYDNDHVYYFFSDAPCNGHSRNYTYPTDYTRDYRRYPGDPFLDTH